MCCAWIVLTSLGERWHRPCTLQELAPTQTQGRSWKRSSHTPHHTQWLCVTLAQSRCRPCSAIQHSALPPPCTPALLNSLLTTNECLLDFLLPPTIKMPLPVRPQLFHNTPAARLPVLLLLQAGVPQRQLPACMRNHHLMLVCICTNNTWQLFSNHCSVAFKACCQTLNSVPASWQSLLAKQPPTVAMLPNRVSLRQAAAACSHAC